MGLENPWENPVFPKSWSYPKSHHPWDLVGFFVVNFMDFKGGYFPIYGHAHVT
jgi:hypothetical protein